MEVLFKMPLVFRDGVRESANNQPTAGQDYELSGSADTGHRTFASTHTNGNFLIITAQEVDANGNPAGAWERVLVTYTTGSPNKLASRVFIAGSSGSLIDWSGTGVNKIPKLYTSLGQNLLGNLFMRPVEKAATTDYEYTAQAGELVNYDMSSAVEYVTNGLALTDTTWIKGSGWTFVQSTFGYYLATSATGVLEQTNAALPDNKPFLFRYKLNVTGGTITPRLDGVLGTARSTTAFFEEVITSGAGNNKIEFVTSTTTGVFWGCSVTTSMVVRLPASPIPGDRVRVRAKVGSSVGLLRTLCQSGQTIDGVDHSVNAHTHMAHTGEWVQYYCTGTNAWITEGRRLIPFNALLQGNADFNISVNNYFLCPVPDIQRDAGGTATAGTWAHILVKRPGVYNIAGHFRVASGMVLTNPCYVITRISSFGELNKPNNMDAGIRVADTNNIRSSACLFEGELTPFAKAHLIEYVSYSSGTQQAQASNTYLSLRELV
jgi:hypothetical protein